MPPFPDGFFSSHVFLGEEEDALGNASCITFPDEISHGRRPLAGVSEPSEAPDPILTNLSLLL